MGHPIDPPIIPPPSPEGFDCTVCWGVGKPFGDDGTPSEITISVSGINNGPNWIPADGVPPNGNFVLTQADEILPCIFRLVNDDHSFFIRFGDTLTDFIIRLRDNTPVFIASPPDICLVEAFNTENDHFVGGSILVLLGEVE